MSKLYKTLCCEHEYIGINHSPVLETGYCLHCGYHPEIEKLKSQLKEALSIIEESMPIMREKYILNQWFEEIEELKKEVLP